MRARDPSTTHTSFPQGRGASAAGAWPTCDGQVSLVRENESIYLPSGAIHRLENPGKTMLEVIEVQTGSYLGEDDIVRFDDTYGRCASLRAQPETAAEMPPETPAADGNAGAGAQLAAHP